MKKIWVIIGIIGVILLVYGISKVNVTKDNDEYIFKYNSHIIKVGEEYNEKELGTSISNFETESCALGKKNTIYSYSNFQIETYENEAKRNIIYSIYIFGDLVKTSEGIKIYDQLEDVIKAYGENYQKEKNSYIYIKGNTKIVFTIIDNIIEGIEYQIVEIK